MNTVTFVKVTYLTMSCPKMPLRLNTAFCDYNSHPPMQVGLTPRYFSTIFALIYFWFCVGIGICCMLVMGIDPLTCECNLTSSSCWMLMCECG